MKSKFAIVAMHNVIPVYSCRISSGELEELKLYYNFVVIPCRYQKRENKIRKNPELIRKVLSCNQPILLHGMYSTHNGDLEEFRGQNYEETKDEIQKGMDIFSEAGVKQTYSYLQHGLVRKKQQVLSESCFFIVYTEEEILILNKNTRLHMCPMNSDVGSKMADRS